MALLLSANTASTANRLCPARAPTISYIRVYPKILHHRGSDRVDTTPVSVPASRSMTDGRRNEDERLWTNEEEDLGPAFVPFQLSDEMCKLPLSPPMRSYSHRSHRLLWRHQMQTSTVMQRLMAIRLLNRDGFVDLSLAICSSSSANGPAARSSW
jgi:hypothetical protein